MPDTTGFGHEGGRGTAWAPPWVGGELMLTGLTPTEQRQLVTKKLSLFSYKNPGTKAQRTGPGPGTVATPVLWCSIANPAPWGSQSQGALLGTHQA